MRPAGRLVAFGDPRYPGAESGAQDPADPVLRDGVRLGWKLRPLPASRGEAQAIARLYPGAETFLGAAATEERAKSLPRDARYVHFACHGFVNDLFPLNSALALTIPETPTEGKDNGLLQAWEVFEGVRLDADLVTLSACGSGLGKEQAGEGLLGLTRAFQYAGARSVVASLWSVADDSTAQLMKRFYRELSRGRPKDEALRAAQMELINRSPRMSDPARWAAFQLFGDWR
jgi:CHAT domain-containing protein